jgi:hypothetical protein
VHILSANLGEQTRALLPYAPIDFVGKPVLPIALQRALKMAERSGRFFELLAQIERARHRLGWFSSLRPSTFWRSGDGIRLSLVRGVFPLPGRGCLQLVLGGIHRDDVTVVGVLNEGQTAVADRDLALAHAEKAADAKDNSGDLAILDTSSAKIGVNVSEREVASMPLNGRQLSQLYLMTPGSVTAGGGSYDNIRFNGRSNQSNEIRYDGIEGSSVVDQSPGNLSGEVSTG